jgi:hypothetical protein
MAKIEVPEKGIPLCVEVGGLTDLYEQACCVIESACDLDSDEFGEEVRSAARRASRNVGATIYVLDRLVRALDRLAAGQITRQELVELR